LWRTTAGKADSLLNMPKAHAEAQSETKDVISKVRPVPPPAPPPRLLGDCFCFLAKREKKPNN
jgi:hypothetical protein